VFGNDRNAMRARYLAVWRKLKDGTPLEPLEAMIAGVIEDHPEYHALFERGDDALDDEWSPEGGQSNPFLHLGLHIAIREQVATDRPPGVRAVFEALARKAGEALEAEHRMIEALAATLWEAGRSGIPPDETAYLERLRGLVR
jgi:hypothetical protein